MKCEQFEEIISKAQIEVKAYQKTYNIIANLRLVGIVLALGLTYWTVTTHQNVGQYVITILAYACFCGLVLWHAQLRTKIKSLEMQITVTRRYLQRMSNEWQGFEDIGEEWMDFDHPYALDLDIVGPKSLFQKINTTHTWHGRKHLAEALLGKYSYVDEISSRQQAVKELLHQFDFCKALQCAGAEHKKRVTEPKSLLCYMKTDGAWERLCQYSALVRGVPIVNVIILGLGILLDAMPLIGLSVLVMIMMYGSYVLAFGRIQSVLTTMRETEHQLGSYSEMMRLINEGQFNSPYLVQLQKVLNDTKSGSVVGLKQLEHLCNRSHMTLQPLLAIPLNAVWFWDYKTILQMEAWRTQYGVYLESWLEAIGDLESLVSLAVLGQIEDVVCFPLIEEKENYLEAVALGHPLIEKEKRVSNHLKVENEVLIITGSNMSGKTTFLRTIGINLILAYSGAPVMAKNMSASYLNVYTSMRIKDNLQDGISTFYAELTRIKQMLEGIQNHKQCICLIDEIFRGTNSKDRIIGAKSILLELKKHSVIGGITTHDLELCQLSEQRGISNYHFTEYYEEGAIRFDYTLKAGPSTTTNAKYLMELVGIKIYD
ncbi:MAG: MutS family DNA mismatch repair protein [Cellulosilyticaceae bacterium]